MISGGGGGSVLVEIYTHIGVVCAPVGEIDRREGVMKRAKIIDNDTSVAIVFI
jgi:hypothetical protein